MAVVQMFWRILNKYSLIISNVYQKFVLDDELRKFVTTSNHSSLCQYIRLPLGVALPIAVF